MTDATLNLRRTLARAGLDETDVDDLVGALAPAIAEIEKTRGPVEADLMWALVATQADVWRRQRERGDRPKLIAGGRR